jgi:hypothetical protein
MASEGNTEMLPPLEVTHARIRDPNALGSLKNPPAIGVELLTADAACVHMAGGEFICGEIVWRS